MRLDKKQIEKLLFIASEAGKQILEVYNSDKFEITIKKDNSPLTIADRKSHEYILSQLVKHFPGIPVFSEEGVSVPYCERKDWNLFWLVDPLDGTKEFIRRNGEFTVNIALISGNKPLFGVIYIPVSGVIYLGGEEYGSYKTDGGYELRKLAVSKKTHNLIAVRSRSHSTEEEDNFYSNYDIEDTVFKGSSLKICMVAEGQADIYFRAGPTWEWDTAAGHAILSGAGGYLVNKDKSDLKYNKIEPKNYGFIASSFNIRLT